LVSIKTLLKTKRRISFRASFGLVKGKAFETGGEISNLENTSRDLIHIPLTICKKVLKRLSKRICKIKGAKEPRVPWSGAPECTVHQDRTTPNSPPSGFSGRASL
jgi:hypothetical protein